MSEETVGQSAPHRLYRHHIVARIAHAKELGRAGHLNDDEVNALTIALAGLLDQPPGTVVDAALSARLGDVAARFADLRSTHDQVTTDLRLWAREAILEACDAIVALQRQLLAVAERHGLSVMPGYTRLQHTGPVLLGHHLLAYLEMFYRDSNRLRETYVRVDILPLGAGEIAGAPYPLDRPHLARLLGMHTSTRNSLDAVGDRDYVVEHVAHLALVAMHLSRLAEDLVLWGSAALGFVDLGVPHSPAAAEQVRGRTGRTYGALMALLTTMKALPLSYNGDLDELVTPYFDAVDTVTGGLVSVSTILASTRWHTDRLAEAAGSTGEPSVEDLLARHDVHGGTSVDRVTVAIRAAYDKVDALAEWIAQKRATLPTVERLLAQESEAGAGVT